MIANYKLLKMNYSDLTKTTGTSKILFHLSRDDNDFSINDKKLINFDFDLSSPNFLNENSEFTVYITFLVYRHINQTKLAELKTETTFWLTNFNLSHNTEILEDCCNMAYQQTQSMLAEAVKERAIEDIFFSYDETALETKLIAYMMGYLTELKEYIRLKVHP